MKVFGTTDGGAIVMLTAKELESLAIPALYEPKGQGTVKKLSSALMGVLEEHNSEGGHKSE